MLDKITLKVTLSRSDNRADRHFLISMTEEKPTIDHTKIHYPTDAINIKQLREVYSPVLERPHFDPLHEEPVKVHGLSVRRRRDLFDDLHALMTDERDIAEEAFNATLEGRELPLRQEITDPEENEIRGMTTEGYIQYGVADGRRTAELLLQKVEDQAIEQARQHLGVSFP